MEGCERNLRLLSPCVLLRGNFVDVRSAVRNREAETNNNKQGNNEYEEKKKKIATTMNLRVCGGVTVMERHSFRISHATRYCAQKDTLCFISLSILLLIRSCKLHPNSWRGVWGCGGVGIVPLHSIKLDSAPVHRIAANFFANFCSKSKKKRRRN
eukprot:gene2098-1277_t